MLAPDAKDRAQSLRDGQRENALSLGAKFRVRRFYLDNGATRFTANRSDCFFSSGIKSFWVCGTNNKNFVANIVVNPDADRDPYSGLPLRPNMNQSFEYPVADAVIEFASQSGVWIDIAYSESEDISIGSIDATVSFSTPAVIAPLAPVVLTGTGAQLFPSDTGRRIMNLYADAAWEMSNAAMSIWFPMPAGHTRIENTAAVYARSSLGATVHRLGES